MPKEKLFPFIDTVLILAVMAVLAAYTYANFFVRPYTGFDLVYSNGFHITNVLPSSGPGFSTGSAQRETLVDGDQLLAINSVSLADINLDLSRPLISAARPGDTIILLIQRNNQQREITWVLPGPNLPEILDRAALIWVPYAFWLVGLLTTILLSYSDERRRLLMAFNFLTAIWLAAGLVSNWRVWDGALLLRAGIWLSLPVYWHLNWVFPRPIRPLSPIIIRGFYLAGGVMALASWFEWLPYHAHNLAFVLTALGVILLLCAHLILQPDQRRELLILTVTTIILILPLVVVFFSGLLNSYWSNGSITLLGFALLPMAYFYILYHRQLGGLELGTNRLIAFLGFILLVLGINLSILIATFSLFPSPSQRITAVAIFVLAIGLISAIVYPLFNNWMFYRVFGLPKPPLDLIEEFTESITTCLELENLRRVFQDELFPRLGILSSALLRTQALPTNDESGPKIAYQLQSLFISGIQPDQLPKSTEINQLIKQAGKYRSHYHRRRRKAVCPWVRLVLPLKLDDQLIGICLLGERRPEDTYAATEIPTLQVLMSQAALAIKNIDQAQHLRDLYQTNITRQEEEMARMARDLHDDVLGQLAMLSVNADDLPSSPAFINALQETTQSIREIIGKLRPATLTYGLPVAFEEMVDESTTIGEHAPMVKISIPLSEERYPAEIELHLYRIIQEAFQNALQYAQAQCITLHGEFKPNHIHLVVEDDGCGFSIPEQADLAWLLARRYFGLATMYERATLIGAQIDLQSTIEQGTRVTITWEDA
jgi:two-component system, NarL family, sensor kinase